MKRKKAKPKLRQLDEEQFLSMQGTTAPDRTVALRLRIEGNFKLLGFFQAPGLQPIVFVEIAPETKAGRVQYVTYDLKDRNTGLVEFPHHYRSDQFEDARADFMRRTNLDVIVSRRSRR